GRQSGHRAATQSGGFIPILSLTAPRIPLLAAQISFGSLNRNVPKQKLDLLQFASCRVTKPSAGPAKVVGRYLFNPSFRGILANHVPDSLLCQTFSLSLSNFVHASKHFTRRNVRSLETLIENMLHPCGHRDRAGMTRFSLQIDNRPILLALLNMAEIQLHRLMASYATR